MAIAALGYHGLNSSPGGYRLEPSCPPETQVMLEQVKALTSASQITGCDHQLEGLVSNLLQDQHDYLDSILPDGMLYYLILL
jgi:hypothetical protein